MTALPEGVRLARFEDRLAGEFERLNLAWLREQELLEPLDVETLGDPRGAVLGRGGEIFFALRGDSVLGTCAAIPAEAGTVELAKLAVVPAAQGLGLGRALAERVIAWAHEQGARRVVLSSNSRLVRAVALYETLGFRRIPVPADVGYANADVYMELRFPER